MSAKTIYGTCTCNANGDLSICECEICDYCDRYMNESMCGHCGYCFKPDSECECD